MVTSYSVHHIHFVSVEVLYDLIRVTNTELYTRQLRQYYS